MAQVFGFLKGEGRNQPPPPGAEHRGPARRSQPHNQRPQRAAARPANHVAAPGAFHDQAAEKKPAYAPITIDNRAPDGPGI